MSTDQPTDKEIEAAQTLLAKVPDLANGDEPGEVPDLPEPKPKKVVRFLTVNGYDYPMRSKIPAGVTAALTDTLQNAVAASDLQGLSNEEMTAKVESNPEKYSNIWGVTSQYVALAQRMLVPGDQLELFKKRVDGHESVEDDDVIEITELVQALMESVGAGQAPKR